MYVLVGVEVLVSVAHLAANPWLMQFCNRQGGKGLEWKFHGVV